MTEIDRKEKLLKGINLKQNGLEIGPLCWPLLTKEEASVKYVDHTSTSELKKIYKDDPGVDLSLIPDVDYPLHGRTLLATIEKNKKHSYIIASHVIEHVPDMVRWLQDMAQVLEDGGILSLAIPDKRYTFDIDRNVSNLSDVMGAYIDALEKPSAKMIFDYAGSFRLNVDAQSVWNGELYLNSIAPHRYSLHQAYDMCLDSVQKDIYVDTHCNVFTPRSFFEILKGLIQFELLDYKVKYFYDTAEGAYEFIVLLEKVKKNKKKQLASIPTLPVSLLEREAIQKIENLEERTEHLHNENVHLARELSAIKNSFSWQLTKPARKIIHTTRRVRNYLKK